MNVFLIKSGSDEFEQLVQQVGKLAKLKTLPDEASLILSLNDCDAVLLDLDHATKKTEKIIKSLKKSDIVKPIMVLCNSLLGEQLKKHQNSRYAADIYLTYPMDDEVLGMMIEASMNSQKPDDTKTFSLDLNSVDDFELSGDDDVVESEEVLDDLDLSLGDDNDLIDLSAAANSDPAEDEEAMINLDEDITLGGIDLTDLAEATRVAKIDVKAQGSTEEDSFESLEFSIGDDNDDDTDSDEVPDPFEAESGGELDFSFDSPVDEIVDAKEDKSSVLDDSFDFELGSIDELDPMQEDEEVEDDFQTKLREIDELLKEDTSTSLKPAKEAQEDDEDDYLEQSLNMGILPDSGEDSPQETENYQSESFNYSKAITSEHKEYIASHDNELIRLGETIKSLRLDRDDLLRKVQTFEKKENSFQDDLLSIRAELDEKKIENSILKKRHSQKIDDLNLKIELLSDKRMVLETKNKQFEDDFLKLRKDKMLDVNKVRSRERELEGKLELLRKDAEIQVRNRDQKILELKRRIDTLEFDIESSHMKERKSFTDQTLLENKMNKVISTLRSAIGQLESDSPEDQRRKKVKSNLDV